MNSILKEDYVKIGLNISYYRKLKSLSQKQLSDMLNCSISTISKIENPHVCKKISLNMLLDIAKTLEVPAYKLLYFGN